MFSFDRIGAVAGLVALVLAIFGLSSDGGSSFGGVTNYDEIALQDASGTTTLSILGNSTSGGCIEIEASDASDIFYMTVDSTGNWATSTSDCE